MPKPQMQIFYEESRRIGDRDRALMDMIHCKENPLTNDDLRRLVALKPDHYGRYAGLVGRLPDVPAVPHAVEAHGMAAGEQFSFLPALRDVRVAAAR